MDIIAVIVDGVAIIYQKIPPGTYEFQVDRLIGYEQELYNEEGYITTSVTFESGKKDALLLAEAIGQATLIIKESLPDGSEREFSDAQVEGIVIYRSDETGIDSGIHIEMKKNKEIFMNLPYHYNEETQQADGPVVSLALVLSSLPDFYVVKDSNIVSKQLAVQQAAGNEFVFLLVYQVEQIFHIYDGNAPIYNSFHDTGQPKKFLGIDGVFTLSK